MESVQNLFKSYYEKIMAYIKADTKRASIIGGTIILLIISALLNAPDPHVSLAAQPLMQGGTWFTNSFITTIVVDIIILLLAFFATRNMQLIPSGLQNVMEMLVEFIYGLAESVAGKAAANYLPWVATCFILILVSNYSGLIPGVGSIGFCHAESAEHAARFEGKYSGQLAMVNGVLILAQEAEAKPHNGVCEEGYEFAPLFRAPSADLSFTFALALATMFMVQYHGIKALGSSYWNKFKFWAPHGEGMMKPIMGFVSFLEIISEISRILTFAFRLFGNIFAGEVVLAVISFLVPFIVPVPFYGLEVMVGAIQAFVFTMLALVFFNMATMSHDDHSAEHH